MEIVIIDKRARTEYKDKLLDQGFILVESKELDNFNNSLKTHPDIQLAKIGPSTVVTEPRLYSYYKEKLSPYGIRVIMGEKIVEERYPQDIAYNICYDGRVYIHNFLYTDQEILKNIENKKKINIKQGYGKCSIAYIEKGIITSDKGIIKTIDESPYLKDYNNLLIEEGHIILEDYNYGFIGGASGYSPLRKTLYFLGSIEGHPDYKKIKNYLKENKENYLSLGDNKLEDFGSLIFLQGEK